MNMKKTIISLLLFSAPVLMFGQLKVESSGNVVAGTTLFQSNDYWNLGFQSGLEVSSQFPTAIASYGRSNSSASSGLIFGVMGVAANSSGSCGYGVTGCLDNTTMTGAGILGSTQHEGGMGINGRYAGYFFGNTKVEGTLTASNVVQTSDLRLKENIISLSSNKNRVLDKVLDMNVVEYNYKKMLPSVILPDSVSVEDVMKKAGINSDKRHIGLIAQELRELFPNLVEEGQDGYLAVNYTELVPILIRSIQELKQELDELKGSNDNVKTSRSVSTNIANGDTTGNMLFQNTPNPFKEQTTIRFSLADNATNAAICIFDMTGKMLKNLPVSQGMESVSIGGYELGEGLFLYSLIVNGREIDTKRMVITK